MRTSLRPVGALCASFFLVLGLLAAGNQASAQAHSLGPQRVVNGQISFGRYDPALDDYSLWVADSNGRHERRLTTDPTGASDWSSDGRRIAFGYSDGPDVHVAIISPDGTGRRTLTSAPGVQEDPTWSPDGRKIAFGAGEWDQPVFSTSIWIMNTDGTRQQRVTDDGFDVEPTFSPDGRRIAFTRITDDPNYINAVYVVNIDGTGLREVVPPTKGLEHPQWSPDGRWIAFTVAPEVQSPNAGGVLLAHPNGTGLHVLRAAESQLLFFKPRWSPDGKQFLSGCFDRRLGRDRLCTFKSNGAGSANVVPLSGTEPLNLPAWGPRPTRH